MICSFSALEALCYCLSRLSMNRRLFQHLPCSRVVFREEQKAHSTPFRLSFGRIREEWTARFHRASYTVDFRVYVTAHVKSRNVQNIPQILRSSSNMSSAHFNEPREDCRWRASRVLFSGDLCTVSSRTVSFRIKHFLDSILLKILNPQESAR